MNYSRGHFVPAIIGNIITFALGLFGIIYGLVTLSNIEILWVYFTFISNVLVTLASFILAILYIVSFVKRKCYVFGFFKVLKLIAVAMCAITFTIVIIFLMPNNPNPPIPWFGKSQLFMHAIVPIFAVFSFIFLEYTPKMKFAVMFTPMIAVLLYGVFYVLYGMFAPAGTQVDWYGFMFEASNRVAPVDLGGFTFGNFFLFLGESLGGALVFGFLLWLLNKIVNLSFVGYVLEEEKAPVAKSEEIVEEVKEEPVVEESVSEEETIEETPVEEVEDKPAKKAKTSSKSRVSAPKKYKDSARVYHISRSKLVSRSWQVKLAGGERAIKIFPTQAEAIEFAKELTRSQGGSIRIHSMKGQLRK